MRRISLLIATTLGAAVLAAGTTASASADTLRQLDRAPTATAPALTKGCVDADRAPFVVTNATAAPVVVFDEPNCTGSAVGVVPPGQTQVFEFGRSAYFTQQ
ncbi:hypothetical protein [Kitasatospora purpeofusca]|uniref:hypothetical protein n=1 Tax=Kitasatospora purpeofusca TaxID=67352 RepID=UPI0036D2C371